VPDLNEFLYSEKVYPPELERLGGKKPCSKCDKDSEVKRDGAKAQKNSGRGDYQKGDAKWNQFLVDYKEASASFTLNKPVWSKICTDTFRVSRDMHPALKIIIGNDSKVRLGIIEWAVLEELIQFWEDNNDGFK
jgi:hypothetical protein